MVILISHSLCSYTSSPSISTCITYENNALYKWCRHSTTTSSGYACTASDSTSYCGGSTYYRCSGDSSFYLPHNAKKLLWPTDYSNWNSQVVYLYTSGEGVNFHSNYFDTSTYCWYKFEPNNSVLNSINIKINSLSNANAEVYLESMINFYTYKGTLTSGNSMDVSVDFNDPVWVLITPTSSSAYVSVTGTASELSSSSSSTNSNLVIILVPTLVGGSFLILLIVFIIVCNIIRRRRLQAAVNSANAAMAHSASPPPTPQLYNTPNQNYSYTNASQVPSMINASPQHSFMISSSQNNQNHILEPVSSHPTEQHIHLQTDSKQANIMQPQPGAQIQCKCQ